MLMIDAHSDPSSRFSRLLARAATCLMKHDIISDYLLDFLSSGLLAGTLGGSKL
jgi:hypothetical protein